MSTIPRRNNQTTALHGLIVLSVTAVLTTVLGSGMRFMNGSTDSFNPHPRCAYTVFKAEQCMGTVFSDSQMSVTEILERLGMSSGSATTALDAVPCFSCLTITDNSKTLRIKPMNGLQILCCGGRMDLNSATTEDLTVIPGIGPTLAHRIITFRKLSGGFKDIDELRKIRGLRVKKAASVAQFVEIHAPGKDLSAVIHPARTWSAVSSSLH